MRKANTALKKPGDMTECHISQCGGMSQRSHMKKVSSTVEVDAKIAALVRDEFPFLAQHYDLSLVRKVKVERLDLGVLKLEAFCGYEGFFRITKWNPLPTLVLDFNGVVLKRVAELAKLTLHQRLGVMLYAAERGCWSNEEKIGQSIDSLAEDEVERIRYIVACWGPDYLKIFRVPARFTFVQWIQKLIGDESKLTHADKKEFGLAH